MEHAASTKKFGECSTFPVKVVFDNKVPYLFSVSFLNELDSSCCYRQQITAQKSGGWFSAFKSLVGNKKLTMEDIEPVVDKMRETLIGKRF